jgi:Reverse transcriptase (RNA-dependent DNA polymerase)
VDDQSIAAFEEDLANNLEWWLKAPVQLGDGTLEPREKGSPQGSVISPLLSNLFLHYAFDRWMAVHHPSVPFERFADDILCHCRSEAQARWLWTVLEQRLAACGLRVHPDKTTLVYCKDDDRRGSIPTKSSTSWASPVARGGRRTGGGRTSSTSVQVSARAPQKLSVRPSVAGALSVALTSR